jgi:TetR/AcrR family transcriptional repressor of nem operon
MRVSREQAAENRQRVLDAASRLFREGGIATTGVDAVMSAAGLTHGGFYSQFQSKEKMAAEACRQSIEKSVEKWTRLAGKKSPLTAIIENYLSLRHRDNPGEGCLIGALVAEASRSSPEVREVMTAGIKSLLGVLETYVPGRNDAAKRINALAILTTMVGALSLARAVDDPRLSKEILSAASRSLAMQYEPESG